MRGWVFIAVDPDRRPEELGELLLGEGARAILLQAVGLGLGAVPVGGFDEAAAPSTLQLPEDHGRVDFGRHL